MTRSFGRARAKEGLQHPRGCLVYLANINLLFRCRGWRLHTVLFSSNCNRSLPVLAMFYAPAQDVQRPTHPRLHVRDARDAHIVFEAVRQGRLKPVLRRLNELERSTFIVSGSLFVWEESDDEMGLKRWTDGRVWSQSRMREVWPSLLPLRARP